MSKYAVFDPMRQEPTREMRYHAALRLLDEYPDLLQDTDGEEDKARFAGVMADSELMLADWVAADLRVAGWHIAYDVVGYLEHYQTFADAERNNEQLVR